MKRNKIVEMTADNENVSIVQEGGLYYDLFKNSHTPMLLVSSEDGQIRDANQAACSFYGYSYDSIIKLKINDINILSEKEVFEEMEKAKSDHDIQYKKDIEIKYRLQESFFRGLFENSPEAIAIVDNDFRIMDINKSFERIFLYDIDDIKGKNITKMLCDEKLYDESAYIKDCLKRGEFVRRETVRIDRNGKPVDVSLLGFPITFNGNKIGIYCIYSDLRTVKEEANKKRLFSEIFKYNTVGVVITDVEGNIQWINDAFTDMTGYLPGEVEGKKPSILKSGRHDNEYYSRMWNSILSIGKWQGEIYNRRKDGEIYQEWLNIIAVKNDKNDIEYFVGMMSDITDARQKEKKIEMLTKKDGLTDLFNRDFFMNRLNYEILKRKGTHSNNGRLFLLFLDIDDFKEINDNLGHLFGDIVLKEFASRLKSSIGNCDIAARLGGDEFVVLVFNAESKDDVLNAAKSIMDNINKPYNIDGHELHIITSMGIACFPDDGDDSTALIKNADIAMYKAKQQVGEKITLFHKSLNEEIQRMFNIKNKLRNAIANNELFLVYQPIFDYEREQIIGVEALLRWKIEDGTIVSPSDFIPIAEKSGLICKIGEWVLYTACRQSRLWRHKGYKPIYVSVNVSVLQLEQPDFTQKVLKALKDADLSPEALQIEITETIFTKNYEKIVQVINDITSLGVKVAIDDFGTGYSSFGQLSKLNINKLKIDRSFVNGVTGNSGKSKIVKAIISMAFSLNLEIVAEGVETIEQLEFLRNNQCSIIQGFIYSKPVCPQHIEKFLKCQ